MTLVMLGMFILRFSCHYKIYGQLGTVSDLNSGGAVAKGGNWPGLPYCLSVT